MSFKGELNHKFLEACHFKIHKKLAKFVALNIIKLFKWSRNH